MKFFKRFRKDVIQGKGLRKYFLYSIGEIILVTVGILIALAVNNRNIQHQKEQQTAAIAEKVLKQIKLDTAEVMSVLRIWDDIEDNAMSKVLWETKPDEPIESCSSCPSLILSLKLPRIDGAVYSRLNEQDLVNSPAGDKLMEVYETFRGFDKVNTMYQDLAIQASSDNLRYLQDNHAWFAPFITLGECSDQCQLYFSESTDFRNRVAYINLMLHNGYYGDLENFLELVEDHIVDLEIILKDFKADS